MPSTTRPTTRRDDDAVDGRPWTFAVVRVRAGERLPRREGRRRRRRNLRRRLLRVAVRWTRGFTAHAGSSPTPEARRASPNEALATAAATAAATVRGSMSYAGARRSKVVDDASRAAMLGELDQLEREYARITSPPEVTSAATAISTPPLDAANAEVGSKRQRRDEAAAAAASSSASPAAADATVPSPARSPEPTPSPYRPASRRDVIIGAGDSVPMPSFDPKPTPTPRASRNPTRISAETTSGARSVSRASVSPSGSPLEPPVREALDAMDPIKGSRSASRRTLSATTDARADEDASRSRDARHKVEHLVGGAFDYDALRKVTELARGRIRTQIHSVASKPSAKPPRVGPAGAATRRDGDGDDFFEDVREAAAFGVGALDAADADESIDAFRVAMRAEVATRIVASRAGVQAEAAKMAPRGNIPRRRRRRNRPPTPASPPSVSSPPRRNRRLREENTARRIARNPRPEARGSPPPREKTPRRRRRGGLKGGKRRRSSRRSKSAPARERPPAADPDEARSSEAPAALGGADRAPTLIDRRIERSARAAAARAAAEKLARRRRSASRRRRRRSDSPPNVSASDRRRWRSGVRWTPRETRKRTGRLPSARVGETVQVEGEVRATAEHGGEAVQPLRGEREAPGSRGPRKRAARPGRVGALAGEEKQTSSERDVRRGGRASRGGARGSRFSRASARRRVVRKSSSRRRARRRPPSPPPRRRDERRPSRRLRRRKPPRRPRRPRRS